MVESLMTMMRALRQCEKMITEGADFIDIGAYSSRPGAKKNFGRGRTQTLAPQLLKEY